MQNLEAEAWETSELDPRLNYEYSIHRLFTYPNDFEKLYFIDPRQLAEAGLFFEASGKLICFFCDFYINLSNISSWKKLNAIQILEKIDRPACALITGASTNIPIGNIDINLNYKFEAHRLYSLLKKKNWRFVTARDLARSGFYYTEDEDNCRCVFCNLEVRGWEEGDTADGEHQRFNPNCPFLEDPASVFNVPIGQEVINKAHSEPIPPINPFVPSSELSKYRPSLQLKILPYILTTSSLNITSWTQPKIRLYASFASRIASYKNWPPSLAQTPSELARAGFYYTGLSDRVACYHCGLGLKDWAIGNEPASMHARWGSVCPFLLMSKGPFFVNAILHSKKADRLTEAAVEQNPTARNLNCRKCKMQPVAKVSLPCSHIQLCKNCEEDQCSVCNEKIVGELLIYF